MENRLLVALLHLRETGVHRTPHKPPSMFRHPANLSTLSFPEFRSRQPFPDLSISSLHSLGRLLCWPLSLEYSGPTWIPSAHPLGSRFGASLPQKGLPNTLTTPIHTSPSLTDPLTPFPTHSSGFQLQIHYLLSALTSAEPNKGTTPSGCPKSFAQRTAEGSSSIPIV